VRNGWIIAICIVFLSSCAAFLPKTARLNGSWRYSDARQSCEYEFRRDGTFRGTVELGGKTVSRFAGRWRVNGDRLMYLYTDDALGRIPPGSTDEDKLLAIAPDHFEIQTADGTHRSYRRLPR
jgi:hypothetical protein